MEQSLVVGELGLQACSEHLAYYVSAKIWSVGLMIALQAVFATDLFLQPLQWS